VKTVFADSSGFYAVLDPEDPFHAEATRLFELAERDGWHVVTTNYVVHETWALVQSRQGWSGIDAFLEVLVPLCDVQFVDQPLHDAGVARCCRERKRLLSLTDCVSFELMRRLGLNEAIACDKHFAREGIRLPEPAPQQS
jgi:predicted nucleic acid-binding protein